MSGNETGRKANGDVVAEVYHGRHFDPATQRAGRERIHWICSRARGGHVLDIGCSQGIACLLLAREGVRCTGVDTRDDAIAYARAEAAREPAAVQALLEYRAADGTRLEFEESSFDVALLGEVIEHLVQPERVLAEAARVLKPGGRVIITTPFGVMPDPDHKQTFFFSSFLPLVEAHFRTEELDVIAGRYIGYVGVARESGDSLGSHERVLELLRETERACAAQQSEVYEKLGGAHERIAERERWLADARERQARSAAQQARVRRLYHQQRAQLEARLQSQRRGAAEALARLQEAREELGVITNSRGYKTLMRLRRFRREFVGGPWATRAAYVRDITRKALRRPGPAPAPGLQPERMEAELDAFLERAARHEGDRFVVMFCGTGYIQERRGNRPMRTARIFRERGTPVFYSYYQGSPGEPIPPLDDPLLFQSPIGYTTRYLERIAEADVGDKQRIFIASFPHVTCARWLERLSALGWVTAYESRDDWEEFNKLGLSQWFDPGAERYVVAHADVTYATAGPLRDKLQGYTREKTVHLSPNAYDTTFLSPENAGRLAPRGGSPVLGYFGYLTPHWFDWEAVQEMARRRPAWQFELIGDHAPKGLQLPGNVRLLGLRSHAEINRIARRWRVALIPFKINTLTRGVDPIKIYEYLALGLPVVAFTMPQIEGYPFTKTAPDVETFLAYAEEAMSAPLDRGVMDRFLSVNRWEDRVDQMLELVDAAAAERRPGRGLVGRGKTP